MEKFVNLATLSLATDGFFLVSFGCGSRVLYVIKEAMMSKSAINTSSFWEQLARSCMKLVSNLTTAYFHYKYIVPFNDRMITCLFNYSTVKYHQLFESIKLHRRSLFY